MDSNDSVLYNEFRKKRVKLFKRLILFVIGFFIALPNVLSIFLIISLHNTNSSLDKLSNELNILKNTRTELIPSEENKTVLPEENEIEEDYVLKVLPDSKEYEGQKRVYLTFDDGPSRYTNELLDLLNEYDVKATFFVIAQDGYDDEYKRIINEGHTLGIHSYKHVYSDVYSDISGFKNDVDSIYDYIESITGEAPLFYRFPGGSSNTIFKGDKDDLIDYLNDKNLVYYDWNVTSKDATNGGLSKSQIANNVLKGIESNSEAVVLMHDANDKHSTIEALRIIFESLKTRDDVIFLPITEYTEPVQHVIKKSEE